MPDPTLLLLPGLGADERLFAPQAAALGDALVRCPLAPARPRESLAGYAERFAAELRPRLEGRGPLLLGGMSFGGQVAMLLARHLDCRGVLVLAGCPDPAAMPWRFAVARRVGRIVPAPLARAAVRRLVGVFAARERLGDDGNARLTELARDVDPASLHELAATCGAWRDEDLDHLDRGDGGIPVHRIHGRHDWVIPLRVRDHERAAGRIEILEDGRHLIQFTHTEQVNAWLAARLAEI